MAQFLADQQHLRQHKGIGGASHSRAVQQILTLTVFPVDNARGRVSLIACCFTSNAANTIPNSYKFQIPRETAAVSRPNSGTGACFQAPVLFSGSNKKFLFVSVAME
jgi:hypothetical protein